MLYVIRYYKQVLSDPQSVVTCQLIVQCFGYFADIRLNENDLYFIQQNPAAVLKRVTREFNR